MNIAKKSLESFVVRVILQLFTAAGGIVIARTLFPAAKGEFTYVGTVLMFLLTAVVGLSNAVLWQYGRRALPAVPVIRVMSMLVAAVSVPTVAAILLIAFAVPSQASLVFVAVALPFAIFAHAAMGMFLADGDVRQNNILAAFPTVLATLVYVPVILFVHRSLTVPLMAWTGSYVVGGLYTLYVLRRYRGKTGDVDLKTVAREQVVFASQACLSSSVQYLELRIDVFLVMYMLGGAALGIYSVGIAIAEFLWQLSSAMVNPALKDIGGSDRARAAEVTAKCIRHSFLLVFLASVGVCVLARSVVPLIYGPAFAYGAVVTIALLPGIIAYSMMPALAAFFSQQLGQPRVPFYFSAASTIICGAVTAAALPRYGIIAAAVATSIAYSVAFVAAMLYFLKSTRLSGKVFILSVDDLRSYYSLFNNCIGAVRGALGAH